ncbi:hypothetical protein SAMN02745163_04318 [Clostridium cavendishii DSM 21758]|uniref:Uncharacterized protein n=1 Tax=Clostridium cavendishii DSM 21758 TaxID=1121302 RepID=A0A1M6UP88_9CLOT|nr:hypothetical protein [Clostridium cavendishii]SHK71024.1 hypothetical protein SAMN02745163_04318 [Clostridium cavendishii DSM 21758]
MNILMYGIYIISMMLFVLGSVYFSRKAIKKFKLNRWVIAFTSPLILIIPSVFFKDINPIIWSILIAIFIGFCILFFEINNNISENRGIKETMDYRKTR